MEEMKQENAGLKKALAEEELKKKKMKGALEKYKEGEVIDRLNAIDAVKKTTSNSCKNDRGMQDNNFTYGQNQGQSYSQSYKGQPDKKRTKGEIHPDPVGTSKNNWAHLQGPQRGNYKGKRGHHSYSNPMTKKPPGLSTHPKVQIQFTPRSSPPSFQYQPPHTPNTHHNPPSTHPNPHAQ